MSRMRLLCTALLASFAFAACGPEPTAPVATSGTVALSLVGGDAQVGVAGQELPAALKVLALDDKGHPLRGFLVNFRVMSGGGSMFAGASLTDKDGYAQDYWTLGTTLFTPQQVDVVAVDPTTGVKQNFGSFKARGVTSLGAQLAVTPSSADLGSTGIGVPGTATSFTVQNTGGTTTGPITAVLGGVNAAGFEISGNSCTGTTLALGQTCSLSVRVNSAAAGSLAATLTVSATPGGSATANLTGTVTGIAHLDILPTSYNFGAVAVGSIGTQQSFTVTNSGTATSGSLGSVLGGTNAAQFVLVKDNCLGVALAAHATCDVIVNYRPSTTGSQTATLTVTGSPGGTVSATLSGSATAPVTITVTPASIDFGSIQVGTTSAYRVITLQNQSSSPTGVITAAITGTNAADFGILSGTGVCVGMSLLPGQTCVLPVVFMPSLGGARSATVQMSTTGWAGSAALYGNGLTGAPALSITPPVWDFGSIAVGSQSASKTFTVTNTGTASTGAIVPAMTGTDVSSFVVVGSTCGAPLAPGATCTGTVYFAPTSAGTKSAQIVASTVGATASAAISGTGTTTSALLSITPATATFSTTLGGTTGNTLTVSNTGAAAANSLTMALIGPQAAEFAIGTTTCGSTLAAGASCQVSVTFSPVVSGTAGASLTVSGSPGATASASLTGTVIVSGPSLIITPSPADIGSAKVGSRSSATLTVFNNGTVVVGPTSPAFTTGTGFSITLNTCGPTILPGQSCAITVEFSPVAIGSASGTLTFPWNAGPPIIVSLTGTGTP